MVFEVFDKHPDNNRAMFGGGRYNGLASIFGAKEEIPAVGFAPGDEPMRLFLESRGMLDAITEKKGEVYYIALLDESMKFETSKLAQHLRGQGKYVELGLTVKKALKAIEYATKKNYSHVILSNDEGTKFDGKRMVKNLKTGEQKIEQ